MNRQDEINTLVDETGISFQYDYCFEGTFYDVENAYDVYDTLDDIYFDSVAKMFEQAIELEKQRVRVLQSIDNSQEYFDRVGSHYDSIDREFSSLIYTLNKEIVEQLNFELGY